MGETAERVSSRRLEPLPKVRICCVLRDSFGRLGDRGSDAVAVGCAWIGGGGSIAREVVIVAGDSWRCSWDFVPRGDCDFDTGSASIMCAICPCVLQ